MKLCLSQATIQGTPTAKAVEFAARAGFERIDLWWPQVRSEAEPISPARLKEICAEEGVRQAALSGTVLELAGGDTEWEASLADFRQAIAFAQQAEVPLICFSPGMTTQAEAQRTFALAAGRMGEVLAIAESATIDLAIEFRADSRWMTTLPTAVAFVSIFATARFGICFDVFDYYCGPTKLEDLTAEAIGNIRCVQLSDLIATPREFAKESDRILPGEGDFDLGTILGCLRRADYDGLICVESPNPMLWQFPPDRVADMAHQSLLRCFVMAETDH